MDGLSVDWGSGGPWLPAYGLIGDGGLFLPPQCALLETILEEEDECEDSDSSASISSDGEEEEEDSSTGSGSPGGDGTHSDWGGWGGSTGSDVQSVIHVDPNADLNEIDEGNDSGSERDFVCPPKRRRCNELPTYTDLQYDVTSLHNFCQSDEDTRSFTSLSRSSSLLQFESLERQLLQSCDSLQQCGTDTVDNVISTTLIGANNQKNNLDSSDSDSELSDATVHSKTDDLTPLHEVAKVIQQRSAENLSEDSGYCDGTCNFVRLAKSKSIPCFSKCGVVTFNNCSTTKHTVDFAGQFGAEGRYSRRCRSFDDVSIDMDVATPDINIDAVSEHIRKATTITSMSTTASQTRNKRTGVSLSSPCLLKAFTDLNTCDVLRSSTRRREFNRNIDRLQLLDNTYKRIHEEEHNRYHLEDSVKVSSVPEDLNLCITSDDARCDWSLFTDAHDSIAAKNFDLYDFGVRSTGNVSTGRSNAFTTSCADLTALDYADSGRGRLGSFSSAKMASSRRSMSTPRTDKTLFEEISEHFDKNLSILTDREVDSTFKVPSKSPSTTFDVDPTNLVTCYAESLERCTFPLDSYEVTSQTSRCNDDDEKSQFCNSAVFFHSTPTKRELVVSTPNLNLASTDERFAEKVYKEDIRASMQHVPIKDEDTSPRPGILGSKHQSTTSVGTAKGVHFCPIVSEVSWRERSYSEDTQKSESYSESYSSEDEEESNNSSDKICNRAPSPLPQTIYHQLTSTITKAHVTPTIRDYKSVTEDPSFVLIRPPDVPANLPELSRVSTNASRVPPSTVSQPTSQQERIITNEHTARSTQTLNSNKSIFGIKTVNNKRNKMDSNTVTAKMTSAFRKPVKKPGFLARFTSFRFSTRKKNDSGNNKIKTTCDVQVLAKPQVLNAKPDVKPTERDYIYIPLKGPDAIDNVHVQEYQQNARDSTPPPGGVVLSSKPPLPRQPPRIVGVCAKRTKTEQAHMQGRTNNTYDNNPMRNVIDPIAPVRLETSLDIEHGLPRRTMARLVGLIETDLDTHETVVCNGKARSLIDLGETHNHGIRHNNHHNLLLANQQTVPNSEPPRPHKSMEFLLDKENHKEALPPENELQKTSSTSMSEHQLRVQRSLQRLDLPDWYRQSQVPREGFLLRKRSSPDERGPPTTRWTGLNSKTTSLNSLGSAQRNQTAHSATSGYLLSPSTHRDFCRWSTSKLNSSQTSPSSSVRSSFSSRTTGPVITGNSGAASLRSSFRQPYLGWRSQEKLSRPRTPAERLAGSILPQHQHHQNNNNIDTQTPEIQSSIKEVTSAIVHYVTDAHSRLQQGAQDSHLAPRPPSSQSDSYGRRSRSTSPSQRYCWLESSFVGTRPLDSPQTPVISKTFDNSIRERRDSGLKLELRRPERLNNVNATSPATSIEPSATPGSATLEDVLASLLGLRPTSVQGTTPSGALPAGTPDVQRRCS